MIKKRLLALAVCGTLAVSTAACGSTTKQTKTDSSADKKTEASTATDKADSENIDVDDSINNDNTPEEPTATPAEADPTSYEYIAAHGQVLNNEPIDLDDLSNESQGWGIGPDRDEYNRPVDCLDCQASYASYNADFIVPVENPKKDKLLYLTFDEGYENGYTEKILDTLKEKQARAVFFVTGPYVEEAPELVQRMIDEGHIVGNHTQNHPSGGITTLGSAKAMKKELTKVHKKVKKKFDYDMYLFRPPEGVFSDLSLGVVSNLGYRTVLWSFAHRDYEPDDQPNPDEALENCKAKLSPGAIYLLHAVSSTNAQILGDLIDYAREEGYEIGDYQDYVD